MLTLLQTTQPAAQWSTEFVAILGAIAGLLGALGIFAGILHKIWKDIKSADDKAVEAKVQAATNTGAIGAQKESIDRLAMKTDKALIAMDPNQQRQP